MNRLLLANLTLLVPVLSWGLPIPFLDELFDRWDPVLSSVIRYWIGLPLVWLLWRLTRRKEDGPLKPADLAWWPVVRISIFGLIAFSVVYSYALDYMHPVTAAVFSAAAPVITALVARFGFGEPLAKGYGLAILLSLIGGVLTTIDPGAVDGAWLELRGGEPLILLATVIWSWYSLASQRLYPGLNGLHMTTLTFLPVAIIMPLLYLALLAVGLANPPPPSETWRADDLGVQAWFGVFGIAAAILTWNIGVRLVGVVIASLYLNLVPIATIAVSYLLGKDPRPLQLVGVAIVLAGVIQAQLRLARRQKALGRLP